MSSVRSRVWLSSNLPDAVSGLALVCRAGVSLFKVLGKAVQIYEPLVPGVDVSDFTCPAKPPDIMG